jgi:hypothetical protein
VSHRHILIWLLCAGWALWSLTAAPAAAAEAEPVERPTSVVFSPHFQVFADIEGQQSAVEATRAFYRGATSFAAHHPEKVYLVSQSDLERAVKSSRGFSDKIKIAELATELGIDNYKNLDASRAQRHLREALDNYNRLHYALADPQRVAEVSMYLSLSYIEQDARTIELFNMLQRMILLDPSRQIRQGFYPDDVVRAYREARRSLIELLRAEGPEKRDAERLARLADTDYAIYGYAWPTDEQAYRVALYVYSRKEQRFLPPETLEIDSIEPQALNAAGNRLMSRFVPCFERPRQEQPSTMVQTDGDSPFSLEFGFAYASFWQYPQALQEWTKPWGNYGVGINARLHLTRDFGLTAGISVLNSLRDYAGFLTNDFSTLRGFVGGDMGIDVGDFNFGMQFNLETTMLGDFRACAHPEAICVTRSGGEDTVYIGNRGMMMGINARPRVFWRAYRSFSLVTSVSASYYFVPLSGRDFNFPITGQVGVSYRF